MMVAVQPPPTATAPRSAGLALLPVLATWLVLLPAVAPAAETTATGAAAARPRIGLALGGGGAKGIAHIGVLEVLDELRIPVACVAGTSIGALVGATFAAGIPPAEIERRVRAIDWTVTVGSAGRRDRMPIQRKLRGKTYTNDLEFGLRGGQLVAPGGGVLVTQGIEELLRGLVGGARDIHDFDQLPIPFRAVATDMAAGRMVVLGKGDLTVAMRASMAIPGAFAPVVIGEEVLADGGQLRNLPVDVARATCADVVIAVSLQSPPPRPGDLSSPLALASRSLDVMVNANTEAQLATLTARDVSIVIPMGDIGPASFDRVPDTIPLGREAALARSAELSRYALPAAEYAAWRTGVDRDFGAPLRVAAVTVTGLQRVNPEYVQRQIRSTRPGKAASAADMAADSTRIFSLGDFEKVAYRIVDGPAGPTVQFEAVEKPWGPNFVRFDLGLAASSGGDLALALRGEYSRPWLNRLGGEWHGTLQIGDTTLLEAGLYQPLEVSQLFFIEPKARFSQAREQVYADGEEIARYDFTDAYGELDFGVNLGTRGQLRAGLRKSWNSVKHSSGEHQLPDFGTAKEADLVLQATYDTRDSPGLPTRGTLLLARFIDSGSWLGGGEDYRMAEGMILKALPFRGDSLYLVAAGGAEIDGELPVYRQFRLGGQRSFPGLERQQLRGTGFWTASARYNRKLADIQSLFGQALYAGLRLSAGEMRQRSDGIDEGVIYGLALDLSGRTPIGNFSVSLGGTDSGFWRLQFSLGRPIEESTILDDVN